MRMIYDVILLSSTMCEVCVVNNKCSRKVVEIRAYKKIQETRWLIVLIE